MLQEPQHLLDFAVRAYPGILQHDLLRYVIGAGGTFLVVNVLLRRYLADAQNPQRTTRRDTDGLGNSGLAQNRTDLLAGRLGITLAAQHGLLNVYRIRPSEAGLTSRSMSRC